MRDAETQERVLAYYRQVVLRHPGYYPMRMAELAPGVVAVEDGAHGCDVLFDPERWQYTHFQYLWNKTLPKFKDVVPKSFSLGILQGVANGYIQISTIEGMVILAKTYLSSKGNDAWHDQPQFFFQAGVSSR